jgi:hypothetical protein
MHSGGIAARWQQGGRCVALDRRLGVPLAKSSTRGITGHTQNRPETLSVLAT